MLIEIQNNLMYNVRISFDFTGSKSIKIENESNILYKEEIVPPMQQKRVVSLDLAGSWIVTCSLKYQLEIPSKNDIRKLMASKIKKLEELLVKASEDEHI